MKMYGATDIGLVRSTNQDCYYISDDGSWAVVADGMGGHNGGETASSMTVDIIKSELSSDGDIKNSIKKANNVVFKKSIDERNLSGMGTTVVLCRIVNDEAVIAHVGDSRAYLIGKDGMRQITTDHSIVQQLIDSGTITKEQAKHHPQRNLITRAVGTEKTVDIDFDTIKLNDGDFILMCSDGLSSYVDEADILAIIKENTPEDAVEKLIDKANESGGKDNITVVLIKA